MKVIGFLLAAGTVYGLAHSEPLHAQAAARLIAVEAPAAPAATLSEDEVTRRMASADRALDQGSWDSAERMYEVLVKDMYAAGLLPADAVGRLAGLYYADGEVLKAAGALDDLAAAASAKGVITVEAAALLEAARIYSSEGKVKESADRLERGMHLLNSDGVSAETRTALLRRVFG